MDIKEAREILDVVPLVTPSFSTLPAGLLTIISPHGVVIGALHRGISPAIDQFLSLTEKGRLELSKVPSAELTTPQRLLQSLEAAEEISLAAVSSNFTRTPVAKLAQELEADGLLRIMQRSTGEFVKAKYQRRVRLLPNAQTVSETAGRKLTEAQLRVIDIL